MQRVANRSDLERPGWREQVMQIAAHSEVPVTRLLARLAIAMALSRAAPERSLDWARLGQAETGPIPMYYRRIWRASLSRVLMRSDPARAAASLQAMLTDQIRRGDASDWTLLVTSAALLAHVNHPLAADSAATIASTTASANLARTVPDVDALAQQGSVIDLEELIRRMANALADVANASPLTDTTFQLAGGPERTPRGAMRASADLIRRPFDRAAFPYHDRTLRGNEGRTSRSTG